MEEQEQQPCIQVFWDAETQQAAVRWDNAQLKNIDFVMAVLGMTIKGLEDMKRVGMVQAMKQLDMQAAQEAEIKRRLR